ncbi:hypothetical protein KFK09_005075 [Dendrobium nobile]|uniref:Uncharacterized protein n=1 Tax=Dendrobium nobile TaxID=94219 RepID=A0A8T3BUP5_DENNO|nr:hypothetical protein KFK09_005075 [Dendrobium nobile]
MPSTPVHPDSQEEIECSGTQQASRHSFCGAAPATRGDMAHRKSFKRRGKQHVTDIQNMPPGTRIHIETQACNLLAEEGLTPEEGNIEANERVFAIVMGPEHSVEFVPKDLVSRRLDTFLKAKMKKGGNDNSSMLTGQLPKDHSMGALNHYN